MSLNSLRVSRIPELGVICGGWGRLTGHHDAGFTGEETEIQTEVKRLAWDQNDGLLGPDKLFFHMAPPPLKRPGKSVG